MGTVRVINRYQKRRRYSREFKASMVNTDLKPEPPSHSSPWIMACTPIWYDVGSVNRDKPITRPLQCPHSFRRICQRSRLLHTETRSIASVSRCPV